MFTFYGEKIHYRLIIHLITPIAPKRNKILVMTNPGKRKESSLLKIIGSAHKKEITTAVTMSRKLFFNVSFIPI